MSGSIPSPVCTCAARVTVLDMDRRLSTQSTASRVMARPKGARSTATAAQEQRIIELLRTGPKTTDQLREAGCYQASARLFGLRARGYVVETHLYDGIGADGLWHRRMARYVLISEPLPLDNKTQAETLCLRLEAQA